jgi:hypothetical protein
VGGVPPHTAGQARCGGKKTRKNFEMKMEKEKKQ